MINRYQNWDFGFGKGVQKVDIVNEIKWFQNVAKKSSSDKVYSQKWFEKFGGTGDILNFNADSIITEKTVNVEKSVNTVDRIMKHDNQYVEDVKKTIDNILGGLTSSIENTLTVPTPIPVDVNFVGPTVPEKTVQENIEKDNNLIGAVLTGLILILGFRFLTK